jgi:hypothetical protein
LVEGAEARDSVLTFVTEIGDDFGGDGVFRGCSGGSNEPIEEPLGFGEGTRESCNVYDFEAFESRQKRSIIAEEGGEWIGRAESRINETKADGRVAFGSADQRLIDEPPHSSLLPIFGKVTPNRQVLLLDAELFKKKYLVLFGREPPNVPAAQYVVEAHQPCLDRLRVMLPPIAVFRLPESVKEGLGTEAVNFAPVAKIQVFYVAVGTQLLDEVVDGLAQSAVGSCAVLAPQEIPGVERRSHQELRFPLGVPKGL